MAGGLLWDKADARISNDDLAEINEWAQKHAEVCQWMDLIVQGHGVMHYCVEYNSEFGEIDVGAYCTCGKRYYAGCGEMPPVGEGFKDI